MTSQPTIETRRARAKFRAWHRGTREADYMIGGFFDRFADDWADDEMQWFEALLDYDDVDIMSWALGTQQPPEAMAEAMEGALMTAFRKLDYVEIY